MSGPLDFATWSAEKAEEIAEAKELEAFRRFEEEENRRIRLEKAALHFDRWVIEKEIQDKSIDVCCLLIDFFLFRVVLP